MTYYGLSLLSWLGVVHDLRPYPASLRTAPRQDVEGGTL
jgi:hypothetical protein